MRTIAIATLIAFAAVGCATPTEPISAPTPEGSAAPVPTTPPAAAGPVQISDASLSALQITTVIAPISLAIESVNLEMPVVPVGVESDGQMEIPESAADAGWYRFGASPASDTGNVVIAAHVDDARIGLGPFSRLPGMSEGDLIEVSLEDGSTVTYRVFRVEQTSKQSVDMDAVFANGEDQNLVLVTCGGRFDWDARHYEDNVVVWAEPVGESP